jgi:CRP-like cAMP-binding protein
MNITPVVQKLRRLRLLSESPDQLLEEIVAHTITRRFKPSETVYFQGNLPKAAFLVITGMVNRETTAHNGLVIQHRRALSGDWVGLANATSRGIPYMHSAITADLSELLCLELTRLGELRLNPDFSHYLLQVAAREQLVDEERRLNNISTTRSYDKLILFLSSEVERLQKRGISTLHLPYINGTQQYFADAIGVSRETVARDLQPLLQEGIIERTTGVRPLRYTILNKTELSRLASSPLRRNALYQEVRGGRKKRRYVDVA